jgi:electron transfer flavoprotein alpha subunit
MVASLYEEGEAQRAIWVLLEQTQGRLEGVSLELLAKGRQLCDEAGWPLVALLLGSEVGRLAEQAFAHGAEEVWLGEHPLLEHFNVEAYAHAACQAVLQGKPSILLTGATHDGRDLAGRLAVRLRTGLNADCTDMQLKPASGVLTCEVTGFGGGVLAYLECPANRPQMATVRPGVFKIGAGQHKKKGKLIKLALDLPAEIMRTRLVERVVGESVDLVQAPVLVCGGRGMEGDFKLLAELAALLGGEVGATRPPVDDGHIGRERQVGQTGVVCRPKVALAFGISGAFHFIVGIQNADVVVAVNSDPQAPIFEFADYCIVGDAFQVLPPLIDALREAGEVEHG